jgi:hypothetical protein
MPVSDRGHNAFDNQSKSESRAGNIAFLRECAWQLWEDEDKRRLACMWCELLGRTGHLSYQMLIDEGLINPSRFLGIDLDPEQVRQHQERGIEAVAGNLFIVLPEHPDVGVLNFDGYYAVGSRTLAADIRLIRQVAERSVRRWGEFALFLNADLDAAARQGRGVGEALRKHARLITETFDRCPPHLLLSDTLLLPAGDEEKVEAGALGRFGSFDIYRGRRAGHRMANLRLLLG